MAVTTGILIGVAIGITISLTLLLKRDPARFTLFVHAVLLVAFYRNFGDSSEEAVARTIRETGKRLCEKLSHQEFLLYHYGSGARDFENFNAHVMKAWQTHYYAMALALMHGYGNVALRINEEVVIQRQPWQFERPQNE